LVWVVVRMLVLAVVPFRQVSGCPAVATAFTSPEARRHAVVSAAHPADARAGMQSSEDTRFRVRATADSGRKSLRG
jgi:hypothetical protein